MRNLNGQGLTNTLTDIFGYASQAANIAATVKGTAPVPAGATTMPVATAYNPNLVQTQQPVNAGMSTTTKLIIAGVAAVALGGVVYFATKKKKRLGDLDTAKTKSGKIKQRKAAFAKMDEAGTTWPKNKEGDRIKKRKSKKSNK